MSYRCAEKAAWASSPTTLSSGNLWRVHWWAISDLNCACQIWSLLAFSVCFRKSFNGWKSLQYNVSDSYNVSLLFLNRERPACNFCAGERQSGVLPSVVPLWIQKSRWNHNPAGWCSHGKRDGSQMAQVANLASALFFTLCCTVRKSPGVTSRGAGSRPLKQQFNFPSFLSEWKFCFKSMSRQQAVATMFVLTLAYFQSYNPDSV